MGWDEVKKVNSDMKVSLDMYQYLNDYKLWGKDSYVYQDKNKLIFYGKKKELYHF